LLLKGASIKLSGKFKDLENWAGGKTEAGMIQGLVEEKRVCPAGCWHAFLAIRSSRKNATKVFNLLGTGLIIPA
jgi:hypothetical protein